MNEQDKVSLDEVSRAWNEAMAKIELASEQYWNSLTKEQQLDAFCAVCRRIYKGEIVDKGTYRYVLYDVFGFEPEAYAPAQMAGYLTIHNSIFDAELEYKLVLKFAEFCDIPESKVEQFWKQYSWAHNL
jgi:hypothetical protein